MQSTEQKLREALLSDMDIAVLRMPVNMAFAGNMAQFQYHNRVQSLLNRIDALALPTDDVKSVLQSALNVLGCLEYGITGVDSWPCEDSVENVVHRIRKVLEKSQ